MSFEVNLYYNDSEFNRVDKNISLIETCQGTLKENTDLANPSIDLQIDWEKSKRCNYAYISALKRYYFVRKIYFVAGGLTRVDLKSDVLMSNKYQIRLNGGVIARNSRLYNMYINDGDIRATQKTNMLLYTLPKKFTPNNGFYVIGMAGVNH